MRKPGVINRAGEANTNFLDCGISPGAWILPVACQYKHYMETIPPTMLAGRDSPLLFSRKQLLTALVKYKESIL